MAFIEASLEELPVSANLGQSCLATKISAPGPSSFGWFCHNRGPQVSPPRPLFSLILGLGFHNFGDFTVDRVSDLGKT